MIIVIIKCSDSVETPIFLNILLLDGTGSNDIPARC